MVKKLENFIKRFYLLLIFIFLYTPIISLMVFSFNESKTMGNWTGFTFKWYKQLFDNDRIMEALFYTVLIAVISSIIATIIGTFAAIGINKMKKSRRALLLNINYLPVLNPDIVTGISLMSLFIFIRPLIDIEFRFTTMLSSYNFDIPYVILAVLPKLKAYLTT